MIYQNQTNTPTPAADAPDNGKPAPNLQNLLLQGLEILRQSYSLGIEKEQFLNELLQMEAAARSRTQKLGSAQSREQLLRHIIKDLRLVDSIVEKFDHQKNALIQILLEIQKNLNWLPPHTIKWLSARLDIPVARIYTIANFYEALSLEPRGEHAVHVCMGTACHVQGAPGLMEKISSLLNLQPGQTDPDQTFTLEPVHCMGCCALGPVIKVDQKYYSKPRVSDLKKIFSSCRDKDNREKSCSC
jgi:NADH-quinone oxidoreductase subunit E